MGFFNGLHDFLNDAWHTVIIDPMTGLIHMIKNIGDLNSHMEEVNRNAPTENKVPAPDPILPDPEPTDTDTFFDSEIEGGKVTASVLPYCIEAWKLYMEKNNITRLTDSGIIKSTELFNSVKNVGIANGISSTYLPLSILEIVYDMIIEDEKTDPNFETATDMDTNKIKNDILEHTDYIIDEDTSTGDVDNTIGEVTKSIGAPTIENIKSWTDSIKEAMDNDTTPPYGSIEDLKSLNEKLPPENQIDQDTFNKIVEELTRLKEHGVKEIDTSDINESFYSKVVTTPLEIEKYPKNKPIVSGDGLLGGFNEGNIKHPIESKTFLSNYDTMKNRDIQFSSSKRSHNLKRFFKNN